MTDLTLQRDADFVRRRSPALTATFAVLAAATATGLVLALAFYGQLAQTESVSWRGRTTTALTGIIAPGAVLVTAFLTLNFLALLVFGATRWVRVSTGTPLRGFEMAVLGGPEIADELHRRFATGDPEQYLPVPVSKKGPIRVHVYRADADRRAFVTIQLGTGDQARTWPIIELRDRGFVQVKRRKPEEYSKPFVATGGTTDPTLR